jgi:hypothetical protein
MTDFKLCLDQLVPADESGVMPAFSKAVDMENFKATFLEYGECEEYFCSHEKRGKPSRYSDFLKYLYDCDRDLARKLEEALIKAYFTSEIALSKVGKTKFPLFPNIRTLPEIDFDLLEPVLLRGHPDD